MQFSYVISSCLIGQLLCTVFVCNIELFDWSIIVCRYYEAKLLTGGMIRVGWATPTFSAERPLGTDKHSYCFDGFLVRGLGLNYRNSGTFSMGFICVLESPK